LRETDGSYGPLPEGAAIVLSESLDEWTGNWDGCIFDLPYPVYYELIGFIMII
jgi:hypothetical protein